MCVKVQTVVCLVPETITRIYIDLFALKIVPSVSTSTQLRPLNKNKIISSPPQSLVADNSLNFGDYDVQLQNISSTEYILDFCNRYSPFLLYLPEPEPIIHYISQPQLHIVFQSVVKESANFDQKYNNFWVVKEIQTKHPPSYPHLAIGIKFRFVLKENYDETVFLIYCEKRDQYALVKFTNLLHRTNIQCTFSLLSKV